MSERVTFRRVRRLAVAPLAVPLTATLVRLGREGGPQTWAVRVVGVRAAAVDVYSRRKRVGGDAGLPAGGPAARALREEGYRYDGQAEDLDYLILDDSISDGPRRLRSYVDDWDGAVEAIVHPAAEPPAAEAIAEACRHIRDRAEAERQSRAADDRRRQAAAAAPVGAPAPATLRGLAEAEGGAP